MLVHCVNACVCFEANKYSSSSSTRSTYPAMRSSHNSIMDHDHCFSTVYYALKCYLVLVECRNDMSCRSDDQDIAWRLRAMRPFRRNFSFYWLIIPAYWWRRWVCSFSAASWSWQIWPARVLTMCAWHDTTGQYSPNIRPTPPVLSISR